MKQIIQNLSSGQTKLENVAAPTVPPNHVLGRTECSLLSLGTEKMLIDFGRAGLLGKARQQPEKVKQVLQKVGTDGLMATIDTVRSKLDSPLQLGYCNVSRIIELGSGVKSLKIGDRILSNSPHAEIVRAPINLCAKVPDSVTSSDGVYGVVGAIGLQGIRLLNPMIGETIIVMGLGLIGQLAVQILMANGCKVIGIDFDPMKCQLVKSYGAESIDLSVGHNPIEVASSLTNGKGVDAVLITASTKSNDPVHQAAQMCRKRGRIVLVGVVGMEFNRSDFYEKELSFQVSCAYGPGRYDPEYEVKGNDYPYGFVRWTEQRNFEAVLELIATGRVKTESLTTHRYPFDRALEAYDQVDGGSALGILLEYGSDRAKIADRRVTLCPPKIKPSEPIVGVIGAGSFTGLVILPALNKTGARLKTISSSTGVTSSHLGKKFGFEQAVTDNNMIFSDMEINTIFITTRHSNHGFLVKKALEAGKHVFVEKPLCIKRDEMEGIRTWYLNDSSKENPSDTPLLMVGFNRRFAPLLKKMKELVGNRTEPLSMVFNVNAGIIPRDHWSQQRDEGGGRIIGEACHFIDTLRFLAEANITNVRATFARKGRAAIDDIVSIHLEFADGSMGTVHYFGNGNKALERENLDIYCGGGILRMNNFRSLTGFRWPSFKKNKLRRQDKGHSTEIAEFIAAVKDGTSSPISLDEIFDTTEASFQADECARK